MVNRGFVIPIRAPAGFPGPALATGSQLLLARNPHPVGHAKFLVKIESEFLTKTSPYPCRYAS